jgi:cytochrome c553
MTIYRTLLVTLLLSACSVASVALPPAEPATHPVAALAERCRDCHRSDLARGVLPLLDGQHAAYLEAQLLRFRDSHREGFPMEGFAAGLDPQQITALAAHFAEQPVSRHAASTHAALIAHGRQRAEALRCVDCHGAGFAGGGVIPRLGNQAPQYLEAQLVGIREGRRYHPPTATGARIADLDDTDLRALAHFISTQE